MKDKCFFKNVLFDIYRQNLKRKQFQRSLGKLLKNWFLKLNYFSFRKVEEEEEERRLAARKSQLHRELDVQIQEKNQKAIAKKSDVDEECHVVDAVIKQVMKC